MRRKLRLPPPVVHPKLNANHAKYPKIGFPFRLVRVFRGSIHHFVELIHLFGAFIRLKGESTHHKTAFIRPLGELTWFQAAFIRTFCE